MGIVDSFKGFMGMDADVYDEEEYDEVYDEEYEEEQPAEKRSSKFTRKSNVVPINPNASQASITIIKAKRFDDSLNIANVIKERRPVIFDVGEMDKPDEAERIVDFMTGTVYGLNGNIKRVSGGIFIATPEHMDINNEEMRQKTRSSLNLDF